MNVPAPVPHAGRGRNGKTMGPMAAFVLFGSLAILVIGGLLWGLTLLQSRDEDRRVDCIVHFDQGAPEYRAHGSSSWEPLPDGVGLELGDEVRTDKGTRTVLVVNKTSTVRLWSNSHVSIESFSRSRATMGVRIHAGRAWMDAAFPLHFTVVGDAGKMELNGHAAEIRVDNQATQLLAWTGSAQYEDLAGHVPVTVEEGQRLVLRKDHNPTLGRCPRERDAWQSWNILTMSSDLVPGASRSRTPHADPPQQPSSVTEPFPLPSPSRVAATATPGRPADDPALHRPVYAAAHSPGPRRLKSQPPTVVGPGPPTASPASIRPPPPEIRPDTPEDFAYRTNDPFEKQLADAGSRLCVARFGGLCNNANLVARVERIGQRLVSVCPRPTLPWTFRVLDTSVPNALTVGYGRVYVTRGLLELVDDEELSGVLGHEVAHACLRHIERAFDQQPKAREYWGRAEEARARALALRASERGEEARLRFEGAVREYRENKVRALELLFASMSTGELWDREYQADRYGMLYAHDAGFRPVGLVEGLEKLHKAVGDSDPATRNMSTHPPLGERIQIARKVFASYFPGR